MDQDGSMVFGVPPHLAEGEKHGLERGLCGKAPESVLYLDVRSIAAASWERV